MRKFFLHFLVLFFVLCSSNVKTNVPDSLLNNIKNPIIENKIDAYKELATYYVRSNIQKSIAIAEEALQIAEEYKYRKGEADILYVLGICYHAQSNYKDAFNNFEKALQIFTEVKYNVGIGETLNRLALIYNVKGDYAKSLDYSLQAIRILEKEDDKKALGRSYNYLGIAYYIAKDIEKAEEISLQALEFCKTIDDNLILAISHEHLAIIYIKKKDYEKAIFHVDETIELRSASNDSLGLAGSYENMALIYRLQKDYKSAINYYQKSYYLKEKLNSKRGFASTLAGIGVTYNKMGNYEKSIEYLKRSIDVRKELGDMRGMASSLELIADTYETINDYKKSLYYYKLSQSYNDSLLNEQKNKEIATLQEEFQNEKKESEILFLQKENTIQRQLQDSLIIIVILLFVVAISIFIGYRSKRKVNLILEKRNEEVTKQKDEFQKLNEQLKELDLTKNKLFSVIAHDLKSPFQGLLGLSQIIIEDYDDLTEEEIKKYAELMQDSASNIYRLLENLLEWAKLQRDLVEFNLEKVNLYQIVFDILQIQNMNAISKKIRLVNNIDQSVWIEADKNMIKTILRNLISNAIKFTPENGEVELTSNQQNNFTKICVKDSGIGIPNELLEKLFVLGEKTSRQGTNGETSTGLGLILCKDYVEKHHGKIEIDSNINSGTKFCISIPITTN